MSEETTFQRVKRIMQQPDDMPEVVYSDEELEQLYRQEPLPPNQSPQLNAEENPELPL